LLSRLLASKKIAGKAGGTISGNATMHRMLMFIGMTVGGWVGWAAGAYLGFGLMGQFMVSCLGSVVGIFVAWRVLTEYLE
jgi:hypothetical protein